MLPQVQKALAKAWTVAKALGWAFIGGGIGALTTGIDGLINYEGPPDWSNIRKVFLSGAVMGLVAWYKREVALATPPPKDRELYT